MINIIMDVIIIVLLGLFIIKLKNLIELKEYKHYKVLNNWQYDALGKALLVHSESIRMCKNSNDFSILCIDTLKAIALVIKNPYTDEMIKRLETKRAEFVYTVGIDLGKKDGDASAAVAMLHTVDGKLFATRKDVDRAMKKMGVPSFLKGLPKDTDKIPHSSGTTFITSDMSTGEDMEGSVVKESKPLKKSSEKKSMGSEIIVDKEKVVIKGKK